MDRINGRAFLHENQQPAQGRSHPPPVHVLGMRPALPPPLTTSPSASQSRTPTVTSTLARRTGEQTTSPSPVASPWTTPSTVPSVVPGSRATLREHGLQRGRIVLSLWATLRRLHLPVHWHRGQFLPVPDDQESKTGTSDAPRDHLSQRHSRRSPGSLRFCPGVPGARPGRVRRDRQGRTRRACFVLRPKANGEVEVHRGLRGALSRKTSGAKYRTMRRSSGGVRIWCTR